MFLGNSRATGKPLIFNAIGFGCGRLRKKLPGKKRHPNAPLTVISDKRPERSGDRTVMITGPADPHRAETGGRMKPRRVRTPGKHIVLFSLAVTFMLALSATILNSASVTLPTYNHAAAAEDGLFYGPAHEFLTDLSPDANGRRGFVRLTMKLVAPNADALDEIRKRKPQIDERIAFFLREMTPEDFNGDAAMARLKEELLRRAQLPLSKDAVADVVIDDLVIQ